jgi:nitrate/nitrite transporter NarK
MTLKLDAIHWIQLVLMLVAAGAGSVSQVVPTTTPVCAPIVAGCMGMLGALGLVSRSVFPTPTELAAALPAAASPPGPK